MLSHVGEEAAWAMDAHSHVVEEAEQYARTSWLQKLILFVEAPLSRLTLFLKSLPPTLS